MKLISISESDFNLYDGSRQVIVDDYPRKFAALDLGKPLGCYGLGWNSELIDPEVVLSADGQTVWVGVDQYLAAIALATGRIRVTLKLHTNLLEIKIMARLTVVRTETEILLFNPDFSVFIKKGFLDITEGISMVDGKLEIRFMEGYSLILNLQTGMISSPEYA